MFTNCFLDCPPRDIIYLAINNKIVLQKFGSLNLNTYFCHAIKNVIITILE